MNISNKKSKIKNLDNINDIIKKEKLDILVVSFGGSCSNSLVSHLEKNNYKCKSKTWRELLCHCPTFINVNIPVIYIYNNPIKAFLSQKKRGVGIWDVNQQKLSNNPNIKVSDENLLKLMIRHFNVWTKNKRKNILVVKSSELFQDNIINKLENLLGKKISHFPIKYKKPDTTQEDIDNFKSTELFEKYKLQINNINNY